MPQSDAWVRTIIDTVVDGIVIIDEDGTIRLFNQGSKRLFGYASEEAIGQNVRMLMPSPYAEQHDGYLQHYRETGDKHIIGSGRNVEGRRRDGSVFPMYVSVGELLSDERGDGGRFVGVFRDTTNEIMAGEELREAATRLRTIIEMVPDAIIVIDERGTIDSFSGSAERLFGWPAEEVVGQNVALLMPEPHRSRHDDYLRRYLETGERRMIGRGRVMVGQRRDGSTFPMELAVAETRLGGGHTFTGFVHDLTARRRAEKRAQDLQVELLHVSRLSAMGQMAAAIAHELNQPLTAIANFAAAAERMLAYHAEVPPKVLDYIGKVAIQADRAGQIIRRLRRFVERGEIQIRPEAVIPVLEEGIALTLLGAKDTGMRMTTNFAPDLPEVSIDRVQIQQVLINLVRNAIEAMQGSPRRELTIEAAPVEDGNVAITVADTGPGLAKEVVSQLFQPFVTTKSQGMGVGLSISRSIVEAHGGTLTASANPGGGTVFRFTLRSAAVAALENTGSGDAAADRAAGR
jgi:two-component system sensor kinase FixL